MLSSTVSFKTLALMAVQRKQRIDKVTKFLLIFIEREIGISVPLVKPTRTQDSLVGSLCGVSHVVSLAKLLWLARMFACGFYRFSVT